MPKTEVESVSKSKAYFETFSYKLEVQKLATFFKNVIFEKLESQFTNIQNTDIVN